MSNNKVLFEIPHIPFYSKAILPFTGQKRYVAHIMKDLLKRFDIHRDTLFLDCFGGSGLLSQTIKHYYPNNAVVWNDYDNYAKRLSNISYTKEIFDVLGGGGISFVNHKTIRKRDRAKKAIANWDRANKYCDKLKDWEQAFIKDVINRYDDSQLDLITISTWFCFSQNYATNKDDFFRMAKYRRFVKEFQISGHEHYLKYVEKQSCDYRKLVNMYPIENTFLILDPPYIYTSTGNYKSSFTLKDMLELIDIAKHYKNVILFCGATSHIKELLDFVGIKFNVYGALSLNSKNGNKDVILYKSS